MERNKLLKLEKKATDLRNNGHEKEAIKVYLELANGYGKLEEGEKVAEMWQMIGVCYKIENDLENSLKWQKKAAEKFKAIGDLSGFGNTARDIGIAYAYRKRFKEAKEWLEESAEKLKNTKERHAYGITLAKLGLVLLEQGKIGEAEKKIRLGLKEIRSYSHWFFEMTAIWHLAQLEFARKNWQGVLDYTRQCLGIIYEQGEQKGQTRRLAQIHGLMAHGYLGFGNREDAKLHYQKALKLIEALGQGGKMVVLDDIKAEELKSQLEGNH